MNKDKQIKKLHKKLRQLDELQEQMQSKRSQKSERKRIAEDHGAWTKLFKDKTETYTELQNLLNDR